MKINYLKVNGFGNLQNKEIEFSDGINLIQGENESGKSTLLKFIADMFYGISKNKRGKEFSDYEKYKPWGQEEFSGKIKYTLDNNKKIEVFRDFNKKNPQIYNENGEDISKEFNIDKTQGNQYFTEQTNIDENMYLSSLVSMQQEVVLDSTSQNILIQKLANYTNSGDDNISYKKAIEKLNKKQLSEVGTSRSSGRPINLIKEEKYKLQDELGELEEFKDKKYFLEDEKNKLNEEIKNYEIKYNYLKEIKKINDEQKIEIEKNKLNEKIKIENDEKINELNLEKNKLNNEIKLGKNNKKIKNKNILFIFSEIILIIILILNNILNKANGVLYINILAIILIILFLINYFLMNNKNKQKNNYEKKLNEKINIINSQIELLEKNNKNKKIEIEKNNEKINFEFNIKKEKIKNNYKINNNILFDDNYNNLEEFEEKLNNKKIELHRLELDKENIIPKLDKMANIEERLENLNEEENDLIKNNEAIELTKKLLENAYKKMKENVTPEFTKKLSKNIEKISNGKYKNIQINDEEGIIVEKENGEYIEASKLSVGTIDQLYMSLRFATIDEISKEKMPIILDETFAYCDTQRLKNILYYLNQEFFDRQIIIFTCTNREKEILDELNINYKKIEL